jgi:DNA-binding transcriptional ArsR family regulator
VVGCDIISALANNTFRALAHPVRRRVVERLALGPATVGEATSGLGVSKPTMTRHLQVLEQAGLIARDVQGRTHRLRLQGAPLTEAEAWLERQRASWQRLFDVVEQHLDDEGRERNA